MCTDVYRCVQEKNGAAIKEFFDVYKMCTDVHRVFFSMCTKMCTNMYRCVREKMAPPLMSFLMCTRCVQMCTRKKSVYAVKYMGNSMYKVFHRYVQ